MKMQFDIFRVSKQKISISVVVPSYNHKKYIGEAIDSLLNQSKVPNEIIVIDDGSSDGSFDYLKQRYSDNERIILWAQKNRGAHNTINAGIQRATSEWIAVLNSDDIYDCNRLEQVEKFISKNETTDFIFTGVSFIDKSGKTIKNRWYEDAMCFRSKSSSLALSLINANFSMTTSNFIFRRKLFDEIGGFKAYRYAHDLDFILTAIAIGARVDFFEMPLLKYRFHDTNTISEGVLKVKFELCDIISRFLILIKDINPGILNEHFYNELFTVLDKHGYSRLLFAFMLERRRNYPALTSQVKFSNDFINVIDRVLR